MSDDRPPETGSEKRDAGVFGNLPGSRPGKRSPRRNSAKKPAVAAVAKQKSKPKPAAAPRAAPPPPAASATKAPRRPAAEPDRGAGLEDIAWAGVAAAAEAATLGVRLASRAIEALRGNSEKS